MNKGFFLMRTLKNIIFSPIYPLFPNFNFEKKQYIFLFYFFTIITLLCTTSGITVAESKYVLKCASLAPADIGWAKNVNEIYMPVIERETEGEVVLNWFWGGIMGDDKECIAKMRNGELDGLAFSGQGFVQICPDIALLELPFLFDNHMEADYVIEKIRDRIDILTEKNGFKLFNLVEQDFDQIYSTAFEIRSPDDFAKSKFITWFGLLEEQVLKHLGAKSVSMKQPELWAMKSGVCDAFISPGMWVIGSQLFTTLKYVTPVNIRYSPAGTILNLDRWENLPVKYKKALDRLGPGLEMEFNKRTRKSNRRCIEAMKNYGIKEVKLSNKEIEVLRKKCVSLWYELAGKTFSKELLEEVLSHLNNYRSQHHITSD